MKTIRQITEKQFEGFWTDRSKGYKELVDFAKQNGWISDNPKEIREMTESEIEEWCKQAEGRIGYIDFYIAFAKYVGILIEENKAEPKYRWAYERTEYQEHCGITLSMTEEQFKYAFQDGSYKYWKLGEPDSQKV